MNKLKIIFLKNLKIRSEQTNNSLGQQCFGCQGNRRERSKCPTYLRSMDKAMIVTLSDDEESGHESKSD